MLCASAQARCEQARLDAVSAREAVKRVRTERVSELLTAIGRAKAAAEAAVALELARITAAESVARLRAQLAELDKVHWCKSTSIPLYYSYAVGMAPVCLSHS